MDTHVGNTDSGFDWSCRYGNGWSRKLREIKQLRQLGAAHLDCHSVTTRLARFGTCRWGTVTAESGDVIQVRHSHGLVSVLVRCRTVVMGRMVVPGVLVDVQRG